MDLIVSDKFLECHPFTAGWEGGWSDHPDDPGGKTMYGVTQARFHEWLDANGLPRRPVKSITRDEALAIFYTGYWLGSISCERLFPGVDLAVYDASVHSGPARGRRWLGDGVDPQNRHDRTVKNICSRRLSFVEGLRNWKSFAKGWSNRIADIQAKGVARALAALHAAPTVSQQLEDEAAAKRSTAKKQTIGAAGSGTSGTGAVLVDPASQPPMPADQIANQAPQLADWLLAGAGCFLVALALWLVWRAILNQQQGKAFAREAEASRHA